MRSGVEYTASERTLIEQHGLGRKCRGVADHAGLFDRKFYDRNASEFDLNQRTSSLTQINAKMAAAQPFSRSVGASAMDRHFQARPIGVREAKSAYPLVYLYDASITLDEWLRFARRRCREPSDPSGLIAVRDCRGLVHAIFGYRVDIDLRTRKRLCLNNLVIARMPGSTIDEAILACADGLAERFKCQSISIEQPFSRGIGLPGACSTADNLLSKRISSIPNARRH
jgi:hypothetical protein